MSNAPYVEGIVVENKHWTDNLYSLRVEATTSPFKAGQFGKLALMIDGERVARPYSYVNAPDDPIKEFYSIAVPDGSLSSQLAALQSGDPVLVAKSPAGFLVLDEVPQSKHCWLISTGTGIGPFLSILKTAEPWQRFEKIILIHAVRKVEEATYRDTIKQFADQHSEQFISLHFVSREDTDFALPGRIPAAIQDGSLEQRVGCQLNAADSQVMLCGNPAMVKDMTKTLLIKGMSKNLRRTPGQITVESYW